MTRPGLNSSSYVYCAAHRRQSASWRPQRLGMAGQEDHPRSAARRLQDFRHGARRVRERPRCGRPGVAKAASGLGFLWQFLDCYGVGAVAAIHGKAASGLDFEADFF
jgi:hypothetical protein